MLGWIYIWKERETNYRVKIRFGNLWFYLLISHFTTDSILSCGIINKNECSRRERWKDFGEPDYKDYCDLGLFELSRVIFLEAPENERKEREAEWEGLRSYYNEKLPKSIELNLSWYPNRFIIHLNLDISFVIWKRLSRRDHKRKPKSLIRWFNSAIESKDRRLYIDLKQSLGIYVVDFPSLIWWLGNDEKERLLDSFDI